jgi:antitoxin ParD1/3/4
MNVSLTPELEKLVQAKVQSGRYNSASEVVREALRLLEQHDNLRAAGLKEIQARMDKSLAALAAGEGTDGESFMRAMIDDLDSRTSSPEAG